MPPCVYLVSGSLPRLPTRITLLMPRAMECVSSNAGWVRPVAGAGWPVAHGTSGRGRRLPTCRRIRMRHRTRRRRAGPSRGPGRAIRRRRTRRPASPSAPIAPNGVHGAVRNTLASNKRSLRIDESARMRTRNVSTPQMFGLRSFRRLRPCLLIRAFAMSPLCDTRAPWCRSASRAVVHGDRVPRIGSHAIAGARSLATFVQPRAQIHVSSDHRRRPPHGVGRTERPAGNQRDLRGRRRARQRRRGPFGGAHAATRPADHRPRRPGARAASK